MGKYLTALAILGSVYLILLFLIETNILWELKARFSTCNKKRELVSGSLCNSRLDGLALCSGAALTVSIRGSLDTV